MSSFVNFVEVAAAAPPAATSTHQEMSRNDAKCRVMSKNVEFWKFLMVCRMEVFGAVWGWVEVSGAAWGWVEVFGGVSGWVEPFLAGSHR